MAQSKLQKQKIIEDLQEKIKKQKSIVFVDFSGLKVKDLSELRKKMKAEGNTIKVAKKTLLRIALKKASIDLAVENLKGEIAVVFGFKNEISPAKICSQFAEANPNLKILAGFFEGKYREAEEIIALAKLPSQEELLAKLVGSIAAPISNLINVLKANIKGLIFVLAKAKT